MIEVIRDLDGDTAREQPGYPIPTTLF